MDSFSFVAAINSINFALDSIKPTALKLHQSFIMARFCFSLAFAATIISFMATIGKVSRS